VKSTGKLPTALPVSRSDGVSQQAQPKFNQVLFRSPNEIVASSVEPILTVWNRIGDAEWAVRTVALPGDLVPTGRSVAISASGALLAVEVRDGGAASVLLCPLRGDAQWNCSTSKDTEGGMLPLSAKLPSQPTDKDCASGGSEVHIALSGSERWIAASAGICPIQVFDLRNRDRPRFYSGHTGDVNSLDFSPDETALAASSQFYDVRVWDLANGKSRNINYHGSPYVTAVRFSPSGKSIVSTSDDNSLIVSDVKSGELVTRLNYRNSLLDLAVTKTARGVLMATGSGAGDVYVAPCFEDGNDVVSYAKSVLHDISAQ